MKEKVNLPKTLLEANPWQNDLDAVWPATAFILHRNLSRYKFPGKLSSSEANQILETVKTMLLASTQLAQPTLLKADELAPIDKEFLFEHFLCLESFQNTGNGQGFLLDESSRFLAQINIEDHLQLRLLNSKGELEKSFGALQNLENSLSEKLEFAYSPKFGFLTADPMLCGTGLVVLIYLQLPALIHKGELAEALVKHKNEEVTATSLLGSLDEIVGDIVVLRNSFTLGLSEENTLQSLHAAATKLVGLESALRAKLKRESDAEIKDAVSRAFGILLHSYQIDTQEALDALSLLKLGVELEWVTGIASRKVSEIFFSSRHAHLSHIFKEKSLDPQTLLHRRAEFLHKELQGAALKNA